MNLCLHMFAFSEFDNMNHRLLNDVTWLCRPKQIHKFDFCPHLIDRIIFIHLTALLWIFEAAFTFITMDSKTQIHIRTHIQPQKSDAFTRCCIMQRPLRISLRQAVARLVIATFQTLKGIHQIHL